MNMWQYVGAWHVRQAKQISMKRVFTILRRIIGLSTVDKQDISG